MKVNGYSIKYSRLYEKFQVLRQQKCLEQFLDIKDAIKFAEDN